MYRVQGPPDPCGHGGVRARVAGAAAWSGRTSGVDEGRGRAAGAFVSMAGHEQGRVLRGATDKRSMSLTRLFPILIYVAVFSNARLLLENTSGIISYVVAAAIAVTAVLAAKEGARLLASALGRAWNFAILNNAALVVGGVMFSLVLIETVLQVAAAFQKPDGEAKGVSGLVMPPEWQKKPVQIEGAAHAYYWHGVLHVHNRDQMRVVGGFPAKVPGTFRIIAVGDSLTYGYGIAEKDTYARVLERELGRLFRVEVLNLGVSGAQSEDLLRTLQKQLPVLRPDLVFYGVCLNDFLPSSVGQYENNRAYAIPVPYQDHFSKKTLTGRLLENQYDTLLMRLGLRDDFLGDILKDFDGYQARFARDVGAMNALVQRHGLSPIAAMVLDQYPDTKGKGYQVVLAAERHLKAAGMRVIPADYILRNDGRKDWYVSRWEGHPNETANLVFAREIAGVVAALPELQSYRR